MSYHSVPLAAKISDLCFEEVMAGSVTIWSTKSASVSFWYKPSALLRDVRWTRTFDLSPWDEFDADLHTPEGFHHPSVSTTYGQADGLLLRYRPLSQIVEMYAEGQVILVGDPSSTFSNGNAHKNLVAQYRFGNRTKTGEYLRAYT